MNWLSSIDTPCGQAPSRRFSRPLTIALAAWSLAATVPPVLVGGMHGQRLPAAAQQRQMAPVLPAQARPYGHSLDDMAARVAPSNLPDRRGPPPNSPFQILYLDNVTGATTFDLAQGKTVYVPLLHNDDSVPILGRFPANAQDRAMARRYWYSQTEFGVTTMQLVVDGKTVPLGAGYVSGLSFDPPLPDGATQ